MKFWLGQFEWDAEGAFWRLPRNALSAFDLRSPAQAAVADTPNGYAVFVTADGANLAGFDLLAAGDGAATVSVAHRDLVRTRLGIAASIDSTSLADVLFELLEVHGDPSGQDRLLPGLPDSQGVLRLRMQGVGELKSRAQRGADLSPAQVELLQRVYQQAALQEQAGELPADQHRKILGALAQKYSVSHELFLPQGDNTTPLRPETTINESWPDDGDMDATTQDHSWTEVLGDFSIASGVLSCDSTTRASARCETALSSDDHYAQCPAIDVGGGVVHVGVCTRFASAADTHYYCRLRYGVADDVDFRKVVAGTDTQLVSPVSITENPGADIKVESDGSSHTVTYDGGVAINGHSDSSITGNVRVGVSGDSGGVISQFGAFVAEDLAAPPAGSLAGSMGSLGVGI